MTDTWQCICPFSKLRAENEGITLILTEEQVCPDCGMTYEQRSHWRCPNPGGPMTPEGAARCTDRPCACVLASMRNFLPTNREKTT